MTRDEWKEICVKAKTIEWAIKHRQPAPRVPGSVVQLDRRTYRVDDRGCYRRADS